MELSEDVCFPNCLNLIQKDETFGKKTLKSKNQIFHTYKVSVKLLQNQYTISLLKNKLRQWNKIADEKQQVCKKLIIKSPVKVNSELPRNINNLLKPFCTYFCCIPENILQENLQNFLIYVKPNIKSNTEPPQERKVSTVFSIKPKDDKLCQGNNITVNNNSQDVKPKIGDFMTARELNSQNNIRNKAKEAPVGLQKRKSGLRRGLTNQFVSPLLSNLENSEKNTVKENEKEIDDRLKNIDPQMVELIRSEIMEINEKIIWEDIAGLSSAKNAIQEAVVWPLLRPDIFKGLRRPPKGILLFGPPGTGKTLIGKCVASQSKSTFFSISASSITSKWIGDGEKMVRALFAVAQCHQPAVIFIDEVDSLLSQRSETEHESSRRIKTEFLVQLDGATTESDDRILLIGATNRPQELDEAARRRFTRRLYIPLPDNQARIELLQKLLSKERHVLSEENFREIAKMADGFSGADLRNLCSEAALEPIRSIDVHDFDRIDVTEVRPIAIEDFLKSFSIIRASVSSKDLDQYIQWDKTYGSGN